MPSLPISYAGLPWTARSRPGDVSNKPDGNAPDDPGRSRLMALTYDQHKAAIDAAYPTPPIE